MGVSTAGLLIGSGGSGKSIMMRHLLINSIRAGNKIPVFFELRQLNQTNDSVEDGLLTALRNGGLDVDARFLRAALKGGELFVLLD